MKERLTVYDRVILFAYCLMLAMLMTTFLTWLISGL